MGQKFQRILPALLLVISLLQNGCGDGERIAAVALEGSRQQAELGREMTRLNREVATGTERLIEARSRADEQFQTQQADLQTQRNDLDQERKSLALERRTASELAPILQSLGACLVCSLPLVLCGLLLYRLGEDPSLEELIQLLQNPLALPFEPRRTLTPDATDDTGDDRPVVTSPRLVIPTTSVPPS